MPKVQPIYDTRERACAPRESTPIQNERPQGAAGVLGEEEQHMLRRPTKSPPTPYYLPCRRICQAQSSANEPPHHKRVRTGSAKVLLDLREDAQELAQTGGTLYEFAPLPLRGIFARTTRRQPSARSAENPSAAWKPINSPDSGKHPTRKTITAVARDAAIWREHKRRQRPGEQDETRLEGVMPARQLNAVHSAPPTTGPMNKGRY